MSNQDTADFPDSLVIGGSDKALNITINGKDYWVPKSVIHDDSEVFDELDNDNGTLIVESWWAKKAGLL